MKVETTSNYYYSDTVRRGKGVSPLLILLILFALVGGVTMSHAVQKHKEDAHLARDCINKFGADLIYNKSDVRKIQLCLLDKVGKPGVAIRVMELINGKWEELTAFTNKDIMTIEQAIGFAEQDAGKYGFISWVKECFKYLIMQ